jgi:hypothetical protein
MYGYIGSTMAKPGKRDEVIAIMLEGVDGLRSDASGGNGLLACPGGR